MPMRLNRLVETDTQQLGPARRAGDLAPRGAKPLRAAHRQRYASHTAPVASSRNNTSAPCVM
jgi:hypothetical protein